MNAIERYQKLKDESFDQVLLLIHTNRIKCGKYADLVKIDPKAKIKGKEFFTDEHDD